MNIVKYHLLNIWLHVYSAVYSHISIEILDLECVLGHVTGFQIENKNAIINPPC